MEIARDVRRPSPRLRHVDGEMETDGHDRFTIPRSERSPERPRDPSRRSLIQRLEGHAHVRVLTSGWMRIHRLRRIAGVDGTMRIGRSTTTVRENDREEDPAGWTESNGSSQARARPNK